ncbi:phosphate acyltransferase PlsX [Marinisporobacter balticus]|uniref:Phosphate acyltransferase n=1 Tax=Marinisporobacter balticus TaxID=2018667 RepID=A0A4R2KWT7_9FIRM|nr:phosphate acyltransferase PlsX [Marinisporobacter balticus]TCO79001.1 phosphate:acyl-[acyl carrier protein] acyltransferase [Marinisporobacter balticus]
MRIAVDGMGGDHAPKEVVKGCLDAINELDVEIFLTGQKEKLEEALKGYNFDHTKLHIIHASEIITNEDKPVQAVKQKKDASMIVGLNLLKNGEVDAFISAGNTGALLAGSLFRLGRIKGVDRPAIASVYPTSKGISLLVDAGANAECKSRNLLEFGLMGSVYTDKVLGKENPSIGLVNIGTEPGKGTPLVKESFELFSKTDFNFYGNVEARDLPNGIVDVIVCDGFVGNVILKLTEGVGMTIMSMLKEILTKNTKNKLAALLLKASLKAFKKNLDYTEYGGAPLLGVKGAVIKAHGSSNAKAIKNAIKQAKVFVEREVVSVINKEINRIGDEENGEPT